MNTSQTIFLLILAAVAAAPITGWLHGADKSDRIYKSMLYFLYCMGAIGAVGVTIALVVIWQALGELS